MLGRWNTIATILQLTHVDTLGPETRVNTIRPPANSPVLALQNQPDRARFRRIDREGIARQERNDDTSSPWCLFLVRADDTVDDRIADTVLNGDTVDDGRGDEELVFNVDKALGERDSCKSAMKPQ
jgi:hypothetical protein